MKIFRLFVAFTLTCFAFLPIAHALVPPPDGGYPGFTTAEGTNALKNLTTGSANTAVGWYSLFSNAAGSFNTATGAGALLFNNGDSAAGEASQNAAFGTAALLFNTIGSNNTAVGTVALLHNVNGGSNTAVGANALSNNASGSSNTATGTGALFANTTGSLNTAMGNAALDSNTSADRNTAVGAYALNGDSTGDRNTAIGVFALTQDNTGSFNTAVGVQALDGLTTGGTNTALGVGAGGSVTTANNVICIGANVSGENVSNSCYVGNIFGATSSSGVAVFVNGLGKLGTVTSSKRFKEEIKPMGTTSEALFSLTPVAFHYKKDVDPVGTPQFGLVAEEVEKVNPDLVVRDKEGKPYSVRYDQVNAMLLNEFLKEHRKVESLEATVAQQHKDFEAAVVELKGQIQKVSAQLAAASPSRGGLEASKFAPQVATNNQ